MAIVKGSDIAFVYSGGSTNKDPDASLGGSPSAFPILGATNNLFDNVSNDEATEGSTDYRAFYIFNNSEVASLTNVVLFIESQTVLGATASLGIITQDEVQEVRIPQPVSGGSLTIDFEEETFVWNHDSDLAVWGTNLETALNNTDQLSEVVVSASVDGTDNVFKVTFTGADGSRNYELLEVTSNDLTEAPTITISKDKEGGPMNRIAEAIPVDTAAPADVTFSEPDEDNPLEIGEMRPLDGFPVWVKRVTPSGSQPLEDDGFTVRLIGDAV